MSFSLLDRGNSFFLILLIDELRPDEIKSITRNKVKEENKSQVNRSISPMSGEEGLKVPSSNFSKMDLIIFILRLLSSTY